MKKLLLTVFMLLVMSTSCLAAADWQWACSNANLGMYFDKSTITFVKQKQIVNRDKVYVWVKTVFDEAYAQKTGQENVGYTMTKVYLDFANKKIGTSKHYVYNKNGEIIETLPAEKPEDIIPSTIGEDLANAVDSYVRTRTEEIEQRTRNAH